MQHKKSIAHFLISLLVSIVSYSQTNKDQWKVYAIDNNVLKIVFQPKGYVTNENVTDAVIKQNVVKKDISFGLIENGIVLKDGKSFKVIGFTNKEGYNGFKFSLSTDENIYGGGERALPINRRGYKINLYNNPWYGYSNGADNLNFSVPFFTSSKGYGIFFDNASKGYADIGKTNPSVFEVGFVSGELNAIIIFGNSYKDILSSYYKLTGKQPLPPRWAMANFLSRFGYTSEKEIDSIAGEMQRNKIPFNAIIYDLFWFGDSIKNTLGNLDWVNNDKWPNPKRMIEGYKQKQINSILITEPFILKGTKKYTEAEKYLAVDETNKPFILTDFYFGYGGIVDIFRKDATDWIWNSHYKKQIANGVIGWWTDLGEPEKHPSELKHNLKSLGINRLMGADEVHNIYGHYWNKMLFENYAKDYPNQRLFHLNRSGFAGSQRYSIFPWSGDVSRNWSGLQAQLPLMLGMSMSGIPYIHADAGGFAGGEGDNELYVRWLQFAQYTPIFRPHGTALFEVDKNAYSFPSEPALIDTPYRNYARDVVYGRYKMMPYNYTLTYKHTAFGEPLVAPLYYHFPKDKAISNIEDEFMWGENILVSPILSKALTERNTYLPKGLWYKKETNDVYKDSVIESTSITEIPVYVRAGSFIPTIPLANVQTSFVNVYDDDSLQVDYYFSNTPSQYTLYCDDGMSKDALQKKSFELIAFSAIPNKEVLNINISSNKGNYVGKPQVRNIVMGLIGYQKVKEVLVNGKKSTYTIMGAKNNKGSFNKFLISVNFTGKPVKILIK